MFFLFIFQLVPTVKATGCGANEIECDDDPMTGFYTCIFNSTDYKICDGVQDCRDGTDEFMCKIFC